MPLQPRPYIFSDTRAEWHDRIRRNGSRHHRKWQMEWLGKLADPGFLTSPCFYAHILNPNDCADIWQQINRS